MELAAARSLTGQESAEPLNELVSADPSAAGADPESACGSRVNGAAVVEPNVEPQTGVGQDAHKEPETVTRNHTQVVVRRQKWKDKTGNQVKEVSH